MNWLDEYKRKLVTAEEAVRVVKPGNKIYLPLDSEPMALGLALTARVAELNGIEVEVSAPTKDLGWYDSWATDIFNVKVGFIPRYSTEKLRNASIERRTDMVCKESSLYFKGVREGRISGERPPDICMFEVSPPDQNGYCSFGNSMWDKKRVAEAAKTVIAQININLIRTYGDNYIHVSNIDYFVESEMGGARNFVDVVEAEPPPEAKAITGYVSELIKDRDTIVVGIGNLAEALIPCGVFDNKHNLGIHCERTPRGFIRLVKEGIFNGKYKTIHPGKLVATCIPLEKGDEDFVNNNPYFELYDISYTNAIPVIAANDNMAAVLGGIAIDLTGQFTSESIGHNIYGGTGGLPNFVIGAAYSKGGRSIIVMPSTASNGKYSRIVPFLEKGTIVTVTRPYMDYVVTEYGIASLFGKSQRERANELVAIAHPNFRNELRKQAQALYWP